MNLFNWLSSIVLLAASLCFGATFADKDVVKMKTWEDRILWVGLGCPGEFDPASIKDDSVKKAALKKGVEACEKIAKSGYCIYQETLAAYYYEQGVFKKGLYWANECAEQGSATGMFILWRCYFTGEGVIKDRDESVKWAFLAAAAGHKELIELLDKLQTGEESSWVREGRQKAQEWAKAHPKAFFNPD